MLAASRCSRRFLSLQQRNVSFKHSRRIPVVCSGGGVCRYRSTDKDKDDKDSSSLASDTSWIPPPPVKEEEENKHSSSIDTSWIPPPNRPLQSSITEIMEPEEVEEFDSHDEKEFEEWMMQEMEEEENSDDENDEMDHGDDDESIDWLQTRRSRLGQEGMLTTPEDGSRLKQSHLEVVKHTLLSRQEIVACLETMGGTDVTVIPDKHHKMGGDMVLVTARSASHICTMADAIVYNLKQRQLANLGVVAAQFGSEAASKQDTWQVVDCQNYIIHLLDSKTRQHLQLEKLWSGRDEIHKVNTEEQWDDYVEQNPVPDDFYVFSALTDDYNWTERVVSQLQKQKQWEPPPSSSKTKKGKRGKRARRNRK